ncbi:MAG: hypothetical protein BGO98_37290 [Myxococcales bacterium 68-20]|nr:ferritin-like domain-containing protein [Myxococcales bacterium]OJY22247.1 MAG: hypothetical protein BGO98_37290 [Myxococcales bacterium 68-20]
MSLDLGHARTLGSLLKSLLASSVVAAAGLSALAACDDDDGPDTCRLVLHDGAAGQCGQFELTIVGNASSCALDAGRNDCSALCGRSVSSCSVDTDRSVLVCRESCRVDGRRPPGLAPPSPRNTSTLGDHIATMAYHEAAAVYAFTQLAREMREHGAPASLVRALERAAEDERRHAMLCRAFAAAEGADAELPDVTPTEVRSLFAIAEENAREGCGRELLGSVVGLHVSEHASSVEARDLFASITRDELRHAAVSLRMQRWIRTRLTPQEREAVDARMCAALATGTTSSMPAALAPPADVVLATVGDRVAKAVLTWFDDGDSREQLLCAARTGAAT